MIYTPGEEASKLAFENLLVEVTRSLEESGRRDPVDMLAKGGTALEEVVLDHMMRKSVGTAFEGKIERISGQKFPDIVAEGLFSGKDRFFGVEVKSTLKDSWQTIGNSVNESTRVDHVCSVYLIFGQLHEPISFRMRPYEDCLAEIKVTHYPRYWIDMKLTKGDTIFDKIGHPYNELRLQKDPFTPIRNYYRTRKKKPGESIWWMDDGGDTDQQGVSPVVRLWRNLSPDEKQVIRLQGMALFPSVFSPTSRHKYNDVATWLAARHGVVTNSVRDLFSAGGRYQRVINGQTRKLPRVLGHAVEDFEGLKRELNDMPIEELVDRWSVSEVDLQRGRLGIWLKLVQRSLDAHRLGFDCQVDHLFRV